MISFVVAMTPHGAIGNGGMLPWPRVPADMAHFVGLTKGRTIVMGRKTWESLPRKPLPCRVNTVLTRQRGFSGRGCLAVHSVGRVLEMASVQDVMIIGGRSVYEAFLPHVQTIHATLVCEDFAGDTYFPLKEFISDDELLRWKITDNATLNASKETPFKVKFLTLQKCV